MRNRAVESVIGFVLVFSLVASSVGVVYVFGFEGLQDTRDAEQLSNVESAFDVLEDNVEDVQQEGAPHRATEFKLYRANIRTGDPVEFSVTVQNGNGNVGNAEIEAVPVVYAPEGSETTIRYLNGAVLRQDRGGTVMLDDPPLVLRETGGERTAVFPLIETRDPEFAAISGSTTVLVRADEVLSESLVSGTDPSSDTAGDDFYDVQVTIETTAGRAPAWADHMEAEFDAAYGEDSYCDANSGTVECEFETDRLFVSVTRVDVSIDG